MPSICFTQWEHVMCLSRYRYSHYDMYLGAMRKVCMSTSPPPQQKKKIFVLYSIEYRNINKKYVYTFLKKNDPQAAALLLFYAKGRWQKELCKRAFKAPKWLWSGHNGTKECSDGQRLALAPQLRTSVIDPNGRMNVGWIWGCRGTTSPPTGPSKRDRARGYTGTPAKGLRTITSC